MGTTEGPFRWAIIGGGSVAAKFVASLRDAAVPATAVVVATRSLESASRFAAAVGVGRAVATVDEAVADPLVEAVYIATPPSLHEQHALAAVAAGKPVLVEKPFALDAGAARSIADAAARADVFAMEAMWTRFQPLIRQIGRRAARGDFGQLVALHGSFGIAEDPDGKGSIFDPALGGGALRHRGVYSLSLARQLLGPVVAAHGGAVTSSSGVDEHAAVVIEHDSGAMSTHVASLVTDAEALSLHGTRGVVRFSGPVYRPTSARIADVSPRSGAVTLGSGRIAGLRESTLAQTVNRRLVMPLRSVLASGQRVRAEVVGNGYHYEATAVAEAVRAGQISHPSMPVTESIEVLAVIDQVLADGMTDRGRT